MIKFKQLDQSTSYKNSNNQTAFVGAREEGSDLVTAVKFTTPYLVDPTKDVGIMVKVYKPLEAGSVSTELATLQAYLDANVLDLKLPNIAQGPIELTIADI